MQDSGIEVWTARPDKVGVAACGELAGLLDPHERERAASFHFDADRQAFVLAHALRRLALGAAIGADPGELRFGTGPHGRPYLLGMGGDAPSFSLTRSRGLVACAVGRRASLGIDVEPVRPGLTASLMDPFLVRAPGLSMDEDEPDVFMEWTALEAFWKARGTGLSTTQPRIALRRLDTHQCYEVLDGETGASTGLVAMRLPSPPTHVLTLACDEVDAVQIVELDRLAPRPANDETLLSTCDGPARDDAAMAPAWAPNLGV